VVLLLLYVDDIILAASTEELVQEYAKRIAEGFQVSSEGPLSTFLGINISVNREAHRVELSMAPFMEKVFKRFKLVAKQSIVVPLQEGIVAALAAAEEATEAFKEDFEYAAKVGCVMYYMCCMRPDVSFPVGLLARYTSKVSRVAAAGATQLLQYLYNTRFMVLVLGGLRAYITAMCDSDWAGDLESRRSTGSFILYLGSGPIEWASKLQRLAAQSTAEAEYIALLAPVKSIMWLRWMLFQLGIPQLITEYSSTLFTDNTAAESIARNPVVSEKTKHIAMKYHLTRQVEEAHVVAIEHIDTEVNAADIGTKVLSKRKFLPLRDLAMGHGELARPTKRFRTEKSDEFV